MKKIKTDRCYIFAITLSCLISFYSVYTLAADDDSLLSEQELNAQIKDSISSKAWQKLNTGPDGNLLGNDSAVAIQFYDENSTVNFNWALSTSIKPAREGGTFHQAWSYKVNATAPANPDNKKNPLPTLDALADAYTVGVSVNFSLFPVNRQAFAAFKTNSAQWEAQVKTIAEAMNAKSSSLDAQCQAELSQHLSNNGLINFGLIFGRNGSPDWQSQPELKDLDSWYAALNYAIGYMEAIDTAQRSAPQLAMLADMKKINENPGSAVSIDSALAEACAPEFYSSYIEKYVDSSWTSDRWSQTYALEFKAGSEEFDFLNPLSFESNDQTEHPASATISATAHKAGERGAQTFTAAYTYQKVFTAQTETSACMIDIVTSAEICKTGVFAAPISKTTSIISLDMRSRIENVLMQQPVAFQLKYSRDMENGVSGVDLPLYLFSFAGEELNAGIRLGWQSLTDETSIGVFYGQKF